MQREVVLHCLLIQARSHGGLSVFFLIPSPMPFPAALRGFLGQGEVCGAGTRTEIYSVTETKGEACAAWRLLTGYGQTPD